MSLMICFVGMLVCSVLILLIGNYLYFLILLFVCGVWFGLIFVKNM